MRRSTIALLATVLLVTPAAARAEIGDLQFTACSTSSGLAIADTECPVGAVPSGERPLFHAAGTQAYTYARGILARHTRNADGTLTLIDCVGPTVGTHACGASAPGITGLGGFSGTDLALSPDGNELYALAHFGIGDAALVHFNRAADGSLTFGSCIQATAGSLGCATTQARLSSPHDLVLSPDGQHIYIGANGVSHFTVGAGGTPTFTACYGGSGCTGPSKDTSAASLALSPDGTDLYAVGSTVHHFKRNANGSLSSQDCFAGSAIAFFGCSTLLPYFSIGSFSGVTVSPDGTSLYVAAPFSFERANVFIFDRAANGTLTIDGCVADIGAPFPGTCPAFRGLGGVRDVIVSPDNAWVYTYGEGVTIFRRAAGGALTRIRCLQGALASAGCTAGAPGLDSTGKLAFGPGAMQLYAGASFQMTIFQRVEYIPPPPIDPTPLDETQGTRRAADPAPREEMAPPAVTAATKPSAPGLFTARRFRPERLRPCVARPSKRARSSCARKAKPRRARRARMPARRTG